MRSWASGGSMPRWNDRLTTGLEQRPGPSGLILYPEDGGNNFLQCATVWLPLSRSTHLNITSEIISSGMLFLWCEDVKVGTCRICAVLRMGNTCHQVSGDVSVDSVWGHEGQPPPLPPPPPRGPTSQNAVRLLNKDIRKSLLAAWQRTLTPNFFSLTRPGKNCKLNIYLKTEVESMNQTPCRSTILH